MAINSIASCRLSLWLVPIVAFIGVLLYYYIDGGKTETRSYYKAGVVEYSPCLLNSTETPQDLILRNAERYVQIINTAASHAVDILVFPECGLTSIAVPAERAKIFHFLTRVPGVGAIPCDAVDSAEVQNFLENPDRKSKVTNKNFQPIIPNETSSLLNENVFECTLLRNSFCNTLCNIPLDSGNRSGNTGINGDDIITEKDIINADFIYSDCDMQNDFPPQNSASDNKEVLKRLSCTAREAKLYLVINIDELAECQPLDPGCPVDHSLFYNTNLVFDRNGQIIAKYRKFNLYIEPEFNITAQPELSVFNTDFGVKFGTFICFDIMFKTPALTLLREKGVTDIVYPTAWFSELPFITAVSTQAAWSYSNNVNLLASGYNNPPNHNTGSGIFAGVNGTLVAVMSEDKKTKLLIAQVPIKSVPDFKITTGSIIDIESTCTDSKTGLSLYQANLTGYETKLFSPLDNSFTYENEGFKCNINVNYSQLSNYSEIWYRFAAFSGIKTYAIDRNIKIEACGIMACTNDTVESCGLRPIFKDHTGILFNEIHISLKTTQKLSSFPMILDKHLLPISATDYVFKLDPNNKMQQHMELNSPQTELISFGILRV